MIDVTAAEDSMIPMTTLSFLGAGQLERSGWPLSVSQWVGLMVPPMSARWHTVVLFRSGGKLYMCPMYTWCNSFETALVTGSLLFVAPGGRLAELSDNELAMHVSRVSIDSLLCVVTFVSLTILWRHCVAEMALGLVECSRCVCHP